MCLCAVAVLLSGCPPNPEYHAERYLQRHGYSPDVIVAVLEGKHIDHETFLVLSAVRNVSVRHMVARNPHLTQEQRTVFFRDKNEFVRAGVAMNPGLTPEEIEIAMRDPSPLVIGHMALNPSVPKDVLLYLRRQRGVELFAFAQNPNCPASIVREIEQSEDSLAKQLLAITRRNHGGRPRP
jgi:hypothetical protein